MDRVASCLLAALGLAVLLASGCGGSSSPPAGNVPVGDVAPDFTLEDVNPASPTAAQDVSPRDYLTKVSAWYFGHAT